MKKRFRVKKTEQIETIIHARKMVKNRYFRLYKKENHDAAHFRFAVSVSKKYGKAYERNKIKRQVRAIVAAQTIHQTVDFLIVVSPQTKSLSFRAIEDALCSLLARHNIIEVK